MISAPFKTDQLKPISGAQRRVNSSAEGGMRGTRPFLELRSVGLYSVQYIVVLQRVVQPLSIPHQRLDRPHVEDTPVHPHFPGFGLHEAVYIVAKFSKRSHLASAKVDDLKLPSPLSMVCAEPQPPGAIGEECCCGDGDVG